MADNELASLRITEIFYSLQGESSRTGLPTLFIRLTGCPLRCVYCDTAYAFSGGTRMGIDEILQQLSQYRTRQVCVTGGEPLAQPGCLVLLEALCDAGYQVSLETSGAMEVAVVDERVMRVMDLKTPSSGEVERNRMDNLNELKPTDELKFVIGNREDYLWARELLRQQRLEQRCPVLFSPVAGRQPPQQLADWILADQLPVRFQIQLHKSLWGDEPGV